MGYVRRRCETLISRWRFCSLPPGGIVEARSSFQNRFRTGEEFLSGPIVKGNLRRLAFKMSLSSTAGPSQRSSAHSGACILIIFIRMPPLAYATTIRRSACDWPLPLTVISDRDRNDCLRNSDGIAIEPRTRSEGRPAPIEKPPL